MYLYTTISLLRSEDSSLKSLNSMIEFPSEDATAWQCRLPPLPDAFVIVSERFLILRECETAWNDAKHLWIDSRAYLEQAVERVLKC